MATGGSGAVFFLGTRAHYQVLQQPEQSYEAENGNASTETIYQNPTVREIWTDNGQSDNVSYVSERTNWSYCDNDASDDNRLEMGGVIKRRNKRRPSETTLCERDNEMKPALLNALDRGTPVSMPLRRISPLSFLCSLARRKRTSPPPPPPAPHSLQHIESALTACSYRESCRCLDCQSRYFECDDSDYTSDDSEDFATRFVATVAGQVTRDVEYGVHDDDDDDEVFIDNVPDDNTSTDMLLTTEKMSVSSTSSEPEPMQLEVAAGTPVLLNYLLTHPITCSIQ
ncbi:uncharacterized protein LOC128681406 [Plodia interpunctella]|uniref:uncharacterized protein LOC128681406 n=1 Tax=Plodia interpunctella TaxID=58824 RepID=UPI0023676684|nr:uncharacterized protein LOC128681406 [Plodia interpunctella]